MGEIGELKKKVGVIEEKLGQEREKEVGYIRGLG
jgi:hypothetical protein